MNLPAEKLQRHEAAYYQMTSTIEELPSGLFLSSSAIPDYWDANRALLLRDTGVGPDATAGQLVSYYQQRNVNPAADLDAQAQSEGLGEALMRRGIHPVRETRIWMARRLNQPVPLPDVEAKIVRLPSEGADSQRAAWVNVVMGQYEDETEFKTLWRKVMECEAAFDHVELYLALTEETLENGPVYGFPGTPAAACDLFIADGWARIESVTTIPAFQRRGLAAAVVSAALESAYQQGCELAYLTTGEGSIAERLYHRLGFENCPPVLHRYMG